MIKLFGKKKIQKSWAEREVELACKFENPETNFIKKLIING